MATNAFLFLPSIWIILLTTHAATAFHEPHLHKEVKIVGYEGPLNKHMMSLFRETETLKFIECNFTHVPGHLYSRMPKLKRLDVVDNIIRNVDYVDVMKDTLVLEEFHFYDNDIGRMPVECVRTSPKLRIYKIRRIINPHGELLPNALNETILEHFEFSQSHINKVNDLAFNGLGKLIVLNLTDNDIESISKEALTPLINLEVLDLSKNKLVSFGIDNLPNLPKLSLIDISGNPLKNLNLEGVNEIAPGLKTVIVTDTPIDADKLKDIAEKTKLNIISKHDT